MALAALVLVGCSSTVSGDPHADVGSSRRPSSSTSPTASSSAPPATGRILETGVAQTDPLGGVPDDLPVPAFGVLVSHTVSATAPDATSGVTVAPGVVYTYRPSDPSQADAFTTASQKLLDYYVDKLGWGKIGFNLTVTSDAVVNPDTTAVVGTTVDTSADGSTLTLRFSYNKVLNTGGTNQRPGRILQAGVAQTDSRGLIPASIPVPDFGVIIDDAHHDANWDNLHGGYTIAIGYDAVAKTKGAQYIGYLAAHGWRQSGERKLSQGTEIMMSKGSYALWYDIGEPTSILHVRVRG